MKKKYYIIVAILVAGITLGMGWIVLQQAHSRVFAFPSDEELASLSIEEKRAKCQIPEDVLQKMSTKDLLVTVLNCPLYPAEEAAISAVLLTSEEVLLMSARNSNGLDALLQRGDLKAALEETDPQNVNYSSEMRREMGIEILFPALQSYCSKE